MKVVIYLLAAAYILEAQGSMLKCGEDIIVQRGEKKTLRFWSTDDELMKVEMIPVREQSDASALLAIFKDSYNKGPNIFESRDGILTSKDSLDGDNVDESLYRIDNQLLEKFNDHLLSRTEISESKTETIPSDYEYEEAVNDHSNFTDAEDHKITQGEDHYTDGQEKIIDEGNLKDNEDYETRTYDEAEDVKINSHDAVEDEELEEETKSPDLGSENNFKEEETFGHISTTDYFSLIDETDLPKDQETTLETTTQVTEDFALESTTEHSNSFVTIFDTDLEESMKDVNNFNQARTDYENTEENILDVTKEPENQESSRTAEKFTTQYPSQQNTEAEFTNDDSTSTNIPLETDHYELRHEAKDSSLATDISDVNVITESYLFTTYSNLQASTQSDFYSEESDTTTEIESSTTINSKNLYTEKIEDTTSRYDEQNQNQNLFKSNPIEIDESTTEIIESTTSIPQSLEEMKSTEPEVFISTEGSPTTDQTEMDIAVNNEFFLTTESISDRKDNDVDETTLSGKTDEMTEATVSKEELNDIISQLKSQEALLFSSGMEGSVGSGSFHEDSESVDIKLNILKNIIKGITSEIASNDKSSLETEIGSNMEQTHLIYPDGLEYDEDSSLTSRDELDAEQKSDEISKGKIHIENNFASEGNNFVKLPAINIEPASAVENNEIILPSIYRTDLSDSHFEDTSEGLTTTENQLLTDDVETTANSFLTSSLENETDPGPQTTIRSNENVIKNDVNAQRETTLKVASEDAAPKVEKSPFEELYLPLDFFGIFNSKANKADKVANENVDFSESTTQRIEVSETTEAAESNNEDNIYDEVNKNAQDFQDNIKNMGNDEVSLIDSTTVYNTEAPETSTRAVPSFTEISEVTSSTNDDSIFSKESGSENIVALLRNSLLNTDNEEEEHKKTQQENNVFIPVNLFNSRVEQTPQFYSEQKSDNQVLINEQGSKVVIIKPNSDILKAKKDHDSPSLALNTETGHYEVEIESTTLAEPELSDEIDSYLGILNDENIYPLKNIEQDLTTTIPDFQRTAEISELGRTTEAPEMNTETYVPFGIVKETGPTLSAISDNYPSQHALTDASLDHEHEELDEQDSHLDETEVQESDSINTNINKGNNENSEYDNIYDYSTRNKETENSYDSYPEYESDIFEPEHQQEFSVPDFEKSQRKINSKITHVETPEEYLANHRISEPLPYLLQTRKGFVDADAPFIRAGSVQHRRDDSQQTFGEDSPFYIKLPGSQNAVPVFLQYEPIKVNYVHADKFFKKKTVVKDMNEDEMDNDLDSKFYKESLKDKNIMKDKPPMTLEEIINSQSKIDLHLRPDPFYVMDPPDLGENVNINDDINEVDSISIGVESKLGVQKEGHIPSVIRGDKPVYPGEYFIKNPDNSYSSSDTSALTNPVFTLGSKVTLPPREPGNLQYTPFPLTTNPPKVNLPEEAGNVIEGSTISQNLSSSLPSASNDTGTKVHNPTENPPSIEYSPIPSIDYPDSFGHFKYSNPSYNESNDTRLYENSTNEFSSAYPEKAFITDVKNDKLIDGPLKKNSDFDIVALANFLHQNQKVWSNPKATPIPDGGSWRSPSWDDVIHSSEQTSDFRDSLQVASPWVAADESLSEERYYSAFHSPEEVPGIDPAFFSYRKMPKNIKDLPPTSGSTAPRKKRALESQIDGIVRYIETLPIPMQNALLYTNTKKSIRIHKRSVSAGEHVYCEWNIKTEPGLYLLVTFHNLSAPYTVDCYGAYIEVERENNGYDARWCGNRAAMAGSRPHVIFAKSEVRITVYDNGDTAKTFPTGFEADIEVIDLFDSEEYKMFMEKKATPKIRRLMEG